jgi:hypothetical protein
VLGDARGSGGWLAVRDAALRGKPVAAGTAWSGELYSVGIDMLAGVRSVPALLAVRDYIAEPTGLALLAGSRGPRRGRRAGRAHGTAGSHAGE